MAKPWEQYQAAESSGPWESFTPQEAESSLHALRQPEWRVHPFVEGTRKAALPMIGATLGQAVGNVPGAMGGAGIGEYLNQKFGITEESPEQMLWQAGSQAILPTLGAAYRGIKAFGPKAGAEALNKLAPQELTNLVTRLSPPMPSKQLFQTATQGGGTVPLTKTLSEIDDVLLDIGRGSPGLQKVYGGVGRYLTGLKGHLAKYGNQLPPNLLQTEMAGVGKMVREAERRGGVEAAYVKRIFSALGTDLDEAANAATKVNWAPEAAAALQQARQAFKRESVIKDIIAAGNEASFIKAGVGDTVQFRANKLLNALPGNKFFTQSFTPAEQKSVLGLLKTLNEIPAIPPGAGASWGSGRLWQSLAGFGGAGAVAGGVPGGGAGLAIGAMAPVVKDMAHNVRLAMQTELGRQLLQDVLKSPMRPVTKMLLSQAMAYAASQTATERQREVTTQEQALPEPRPLVPELAKTAQRH